MTDQDEVSTGELYRLCQRIEIAVNRTNGRVNTLENEVAVLKDREERAKDTHARTVGYGSMLAAAGTFLWQLWTGK